MNSKKILEKPYETLKDPKRGRLLLIAILVLSLLFVPMYYMAMSKIKDMAKDEVASEIDNPVQVKDEGSGVKDPVQESTMKTGGAFEDDLQEGLKKWNADEIKKVKDFLDIKANRSATMELIVKAIEVKEGYYASLVSNKEKISPDNYAYYEEALIKSLAMSNEFLRAFDSKSTISDLKVIIEKYTK